MNEKFIIFKTGYEKLNFDNLSKLQKWDPIMFSEACKNYLKQNL